MNYDRKTKQYPFRMIAEKRKIVFRKLPSFRGDKEMKETFREPVNIEDFSDNAPGVSGITRVRFNQSSRRVF